MLGGQRDKALRGNGENFCKNTRIYRQSWGVVFKNSGSGQFFRGKLAEIMHLYFVGVIKNIAHEGSMGGKKDASLGPA